MAKNINRCLANTSGRLAEALNDTALVSNLINTAGYRLYLVGGMVRDSIHHAPPQSGGMDFDCTTDASPDEILRIVEPHAKTVWTQGKHFGTIGCTIDGHDFEITTHRADRYDPASRKPVVGFGKDITEDLHRRDFTVNAMAVDTANRTLFDPFGGQQDLANRVLRTPSDPVIAFTEDPLRLLRAARFAARFGLEPVPEMLAAATATRDRLNIVSADRIRSELQKLILLPDPSKGFGFLARTGLMGCALPELVLSTSESDAGSAAGSTKILGRTVTAVAPHPTLRWAALFTTVSVSDAEARMRALHSTNKLIADTGKYLIALRLLRNPPHDTAGVRRTVHNCPIPIQTAIDFTEAMLNARDEPIAALSCFSETLNELRSTEGLPNTVPLRGDEIMSTLDIQPGPLIGKALEFLKNKVIEQGQIPKQEAVELLLGWAQNNIRSIQ